MAQERESFLTTWVHTQQLITSEAQPDIVHPQITFSDQPVRLALRLMTRGANLELPSEWWKHAEWTLRDETRGTTRHLSSADLTISTNRSDAARRGDRSVPGEGQMAVAEFEAEPLQPGDYSLSARLALDEALLQSQHFRFSVRTGDEDEDTRRVYLRTKASLIASTPAEDRFVRYRSTMLELARLEPSNPGIWEQLADTSAGVASAEETLGYYDRALALSEANLIEKYGSVLALPNSIQKDWQERRRALTAFSRAYASLTAEDRLIVQNRGSRKQVIVVRAGKAVRTIE